MADEEVDEVEGDVEGDALGVEAGDVEAGDIDDLGAVMVKQLGDLLDGWGDILEVLARRGVDPVPLLQALGRTLRAAADQFDPGPASPADP